jgi:hypothetical protein
MFDLSLLETFLLLVFAHALADYPLQGEFLARAKNHRAPLPGVPWYQALGAHAVIHAGFMGLVTGSIWLALAELVAHSLTDHAKCAGLIGFNTDQAVHVASKLAWVGLIYLGVP